jgi:hypothetical protein
MSLNAKTYLPVASQLDRQVERNGARVERG